MEEILRLVGLKPEQAKRSALDVSIRAQIINLLLELKERLDLSYIKISHDLSVMEHMSDRVAGMYFGQIVENCP